eukprot:1144939-Pelagomonas_calceolata.AAC.4
MSNGQHNGGGARVQAVAGALQVLARLAHVQHALLLCVRVRACVRVRVHCGHAKVLHEMQDSCILWGMKQTKFRALGDAAAHHHLLRVVNGINGALLGRLIHTPDGAHTDTGINVGGAIQRVKAHDVVTCKEQNLVAKQSCIFMTVICRACKMGMRLMNCLQNPYFAANPWRIPALQRQCQEDNDSIEQCSTQQCRNFIICRIPRLFQAFLKGPQVPPLLCC